MPSRVIRGDAIASNSLSRVSLGAEHLFLRLLLAVDDYGRCDGRAAIVRNLCFPIREDVTAEDVADWIEELCFADGDAGPVKRYLVLEREYLQLVNWEKHRSNSKRAISSRFPEPEQADTNSPKIPGTFLNSPGIPENPHSGDGCLVTGDGCGDDVTGGGCGGRAASEALAPPAEPAGVCAPDFVLSPSEPSAESEATREAEPEALEGEEKKPRGKPVPEWALRCADRMIELLGSVKGARIPRGARSRWARDLAAMPGEIASLGANGSAERTILKAIEWALGPENLEQPYEVVIRSGESFRRKFPQLVAAKRRKKREANPMSEMEQWATAVDHLHEPFTEAELRAKFGIAH